MIGSGKSTSKKLLQVNTFTKKDGQSMKDFELAKYMNISIERLVKDVVKSTFHNQKGTAFLIKYVKCMKTSSQKRLKSEKPYNTFPSF